MKENFWEFRNSGGRTAELLLYGDISQRSWYGDEITPVSFAKELESQGAIDELTVHINSGGGDVFAAQAIGNLLERHSAKVTAVIDGLCASAATIIACHCDSVKACADSSYMIHPVRMGVFDYCESAELEKYISALKVIKQNIVSLYAKKTGLTEQRAAELMDATSWWTAEQAKENGFVDEIISCDRPAVIENREGLLFVNRVNVHLPFDKAPQFFKDSVIAENKKEEKKLEKEIKTVGELREAYPELVDAIERAAEKNAAEAERQRIRDIEEMSLPENAQTAFTAKYEKPMSAAEYAKTAVASIKKKKGLWSRDAFDDAEKSGMDDVGGFGKEKGDPFMDAITNCKMF